MYGTIASGYDELYGQEQLEKLQKVKHVLKGKVLDLGAGTGIVAKHISDVTSTDPCKEMLELAPEPKLVCKAEELPYKSGSFDSIVSLTALHHTDIDKVIQIIKRISPKNIAITILKKSKKHDEIVNKLKTAFHLEEISDKKDTILIKNSKN